MFKTTRFVEPIIFKARFYKRPLPDCYGWVTFVFLIYLIGFSLQKPLWTLNVDVIPTNLSTRPRAYTV